MHTQNQFERTLLRMDLSLTVFGHATRHEFDDDFVSLRTPSLDINNQEVLSAMVTQESKEIQEEEADAPINQIKQ